MTHEHTVTLGDELERLDAELNDLVERLGGADSETATAKRLFREARDLDQAGQAVSVLIEKHGDDAEITVRELDGDLWARVEDRVDALSKAKPGPGGVPGSSRNVYAAAGLVEAPFLNGVEADDLAGKTRAISDQTPAPGVQKWLEMLVDEQGAVDEGNWQPLAERFAAKAQSPEGSSSTTP